MIVFPLSFPNACNNISPHNACSFCPGLIKMSPKEGVDSVTAHLGACAEIIMLHGVVGTGSEKGAF